MRHKRIVLTFVDHGWEVGATSEPGTKTCGQDLDLTAALMAAVVDSENNTAPEDSRRPRPIDPGTEDAA
ncbi:MAG: hypothetical protein AAFN27_14955 [Pseudomonadota bacterium]